MNNKIQKRPNALERIKSNPLITWKQNGQLSQVAGFPYESKSQKELLYKKLIEESKSEYI